MNLNVDSPGPLVEAAAARAAVEEPREEDLEVFLIDMAGRGGPVDDDARQRSAWLMRLARGL